MRRSEEVLACAAAVFALGAMGVLFSDSVVNSKHNLSVTGPGTIKAATENQVCIFCHAPHNASPDAPLWNRSASGAPYTPYSSTTALSSPGQPTGASRLCLSCHDGTVALGMVGSRTDEILFSGGGRFLPDGASKLGTDLSDDHPISFLYDQFLADQHGQLVSPANLPAPVRLDQGGNMQCTTCHDPHDNRYGMFLVQSNQAAALCTACHAPTGWADFSTHRLSVAIWNGQPPDPWPHTTRIRVSDNGCENCHRPHGAASPQRLPIFALSEGGCLPCHNGHVARKNIESELGKLSVHPVTATESHLPRESLLNPPTRHSECVDCHNPHAAGGGSATLVGALDGVRGYSASGTELAQVAYEYELCFRCHSDSAPPAAYLLQRQFPLTNTRLEFDTLNSSYHPVLDIGKNPAVASLFGDWTPSSIIACTDCHSNDSGPNAGGTGPYGPHGSIYRPILERQMVLADGTTNDQTDFALCYKCHSQAVVMSDDPALTFSEHTKHVSPTGIVQASCSTCHDPHGVQSVPHLINFNVDPSYTERVRPSTTNGLLEFVDGPLPLTGSCSLLCHGVDHVGMTYPRLGL